MLNPWHVSCGTHRPWGIFSDPGSGALGHLLQPRKWMLGRGYHLPGISILTHPWQPPTVAHAWIPLRASKLTPLIWPFLSIHPADSCLSHLAKCPLSSNALPFSKDPAGSLFPVEPRCWPQLSRVCNWQHPICALGSPQAPGRLEEATFQRGANVFADICGQ